jgi:hypothetical protein
LNKKVSYIFVGNLGWKSTALSKRRDIHSCLQSLFMKNSLNVFLKMGIFIYIIYEENELILTISSSNRYLYDIADREGRQVLEKTLCTTKRWNGYLNYR